MMAIGLRQKKTEALEEPAEEAEAKTLDRDSGWRDGPLDPFILDFEPEEAAIAPAPAAARPAPPRPRSGQKVKRKRRTRIVAVASYVLLFVVVASLSAAIVWVFV
jgi:hypothetical protein